MATEDNGRGIGGWRAVINDGSLSEAVVAHSAKGEQIHPR
jgi:hypothetical protein